MRARSVPKEMTEIDLVLTGLKQLPDAPDAPARTPKLRPEPDLQFKSPANF